MKMKMKTACCWILLVGQITWYSCTNNVDEPMIDCSISSLEVSVASQTNATCSIPGSLMVAATGGSDEYEFSIDGVDFQVSTTFDGLSAGDYTVVVRDSDGCMDTHPVEVVGDSGSVSLSLEFTNTTCGETEGTIIATATGGIPPYSFSLNGESPQDNGSFTGLPAGENSVTVADDDGCEAERSAVIVTGVSLATDVMPIVESNCAVTGCHNGSRSPNLSSGDAIIGSASRVKARTSAGTMPPSGRPSLTASEIELIACWVDDGAPNN